VDFINYLRAACSGMAGNGPVYPYVFPVRRPERKPKELALRAGYYCIDTFTPLDRNAYNAARAAADTALTAAELVSNGQAAAAYALCRPPGHHAGKRTYGGFCYFNNNAMAAQLLAGSGNKVAILDIDFHHGNGQQEIFYERADVLTVSLHGHPNFAYPYFSGFADETGQGHGRGFNLNLPLPDGANEELYLEALEKAIYRIQRFSPRFLVVALGFDTMKGDPTGGFALTHRSLRKIGARIGALQLPAVVVQEGGYNLTNLQNGATAFFKGLYETLIIGPP
jgi:acetoin utilization deacetylase AcuC-like enzyme